MLLIRYLVHLRFSVSRKALTVLEEQLLSTYDAVYLVHVLILCFYV